MKRELADSSPHPAPKTVTVGEFFLQSQRPRQRSLAFLLAACLAGFFALPRPAEGQDDACLVCHRDADLTMERGGATVPLFVDEAKLGSSLHGGFSCTDCHEGFDPDSFPHREPMVRANCLACHGDLGKSHAFHPSIGEASAPGGGADVDCARCHGAHDIVSVQDATFRFAPARRNEACGTCHGAELTQFLSSAHLGPPDGLHPDCLACHSIDIVDGRRPLLETKLAQSRLCLSCHVDRPEAAARTRLAGRFVASWGSSVHGRALEGGEAAAANCVDCHGSHQMQRAMVADSRVNKLHIPETCRACHEAEADAFGRGVHAAALQRGVLDSPVCTDCHGEHLILAARDPASPVAPSNVSRQLCGECHGSVRLAQKYGISGDRFRTFADSYHGMATRGGAVEVANCASCHGAHEILPSTDPRSPINKSNLAATCGQCHPGANARFAVGSVHVSMAPRRAGAETTTEPAIQIIATIYVWAITVIVGGMLVHNLLDFLKKLRRKIHGHGEGPGALAHVRAHVPHRLYLRMTGNERLQHGLLALSFIVLVVTGFMLRYPEAWWVVGLREFSDELFGLRGWLHRAAAVLMMAAGAWHVWYVAATRRGRELIRDLWPRRSDFTDAWGVLRYNLGLARTKPAFGRFSYIEKTEYWAMLWGSVLMTLTGVMLWADDTTMSLVTKLGFDIAHVVHFYEAILATLAIIVWHFYFVIFNPEVYPMNLSWLTGYLSEAEMAEEHPAELARRQGEAEAAEEEDRKPGSEPSREGDRPAGSDR